MSDGQTKQDRSGAGLSTSLSKALLGKRITATEFAQFRRPTGDNAQPFDYDLAGLKRYCDNMGYVTPTLPNDQSQRTPKAAEGGLT